MELTIDALLRDFRVVRRSMSAEKPNKYAKYAANPIGYVHDVLNARTWAKQEEILEGLIKPPYKVLAKACHTVGKSFIAAAATNWWYDTFNPSIVLTTAMKYQQVKDILWKEIRLQRKRNNLGGFAGPKMPRLESSEDHFAMGFTANTSTAAQGHHGLAILIIFDEAVGIDSEMWDAAAGMLQGVRFAFLGICNPTDMSSRFYTEEQTGNYTVIHMDAREHPNIAAELAGEPAPFPSAIRLAWLKEKLGEWCRPTVSPKPGDIEWPPNSGKFLHPGPLAEARLLGRWPSQTEGVWSDVLWGSIEKVVEPSLNMFLELGCDVARFGDDDTAIHVRCGGVSLHHESANGWSTAETAGRLKQLCHEWAAWATARQQENKPPVDPKSITVKIDDDGVGGGVVDQADGYNFRGCSAAAKATMQKDYPNRRSELWFATAQRAEMGMLSIGRLPPETRQRLKVQAMAPIYKLDAAGRRVVEPKHLTKEKLGRSPDDIDAMNLAFLDMPNTSPVTGVDTRRPVQFVPTTAASETSAHRRGLFGVGNR